MKLPLKILWTIFVIILSTNSLVAYEKNEPIILKNMHGTPENPYIIEGYEISNPSGDCIKIVNSENIIIRNNYLHDCGTDEDFQERTDHYSEGYACLIGDSSNINFENNTLNNNFRGFMGYNTQNMKAKGNTITNTIQYSPLWCERCSDSEFAFNYLSDNGDPMHFWVPSDRSIGIWVKRSDNVKIHDNTVIRSTSDGISITGNIYLPSFTAKEDTSKPHPQADWSGISSNSEIYNNLILDNMEQGIWLVNARGIKVYNNTIRTGCFTSGSPISTEFNVGDSEFYENKFLGCLNNIVGGANSFNIYVHDNIFYSFDGNRNDFTHFSDDLLGVGDLAKRQNAGAVIPTSIGNKERNNKWVSIKGKLAEEMEEKLQYAHKFKTYEPKGWIACEQEDGTIDEECKKREEAKGDQGVPREQITYSSLMEDFDFYAYENIPEKIVPLIPEKEPKKNISETKSSKEEEKTGIAYIVEQLIESWEATLIGFLMMCAIISTLVYMIKKKQDT